MRDHAFTIMVVVLGLVLVGYAGYSGTIMPLGIATLLFAAALVHHAMVIWDLHEDIRAEDTADQARGQDRTARIRQRLEATDAMAVIDRLKAAKPDDH